MSDKIEINCVGMKCPRPIIEIAKAARRSPPNATITIIADDLAFESDLNAWAENTNASILSFVKDGNQITAIIQLQ